MATQPFGTASGTSRNSREPVVRSAGWRRARRRSWIRPFRRTRRAIEIAERLIGSCCRVIIACETLSDEHPIRATRQLEKVARWLGEATDQLGLGADDLNTTMQQIALSLTYSADAPEALLMLSHQWIGAAEMLEVISGRFDDTFTAVVDYVKGGTAPLDLSELLPKPGPAPRRISFAVRRPSLKFLSVENRRVFCIHVRRQRSARVTAAEAPRRIVRGRAPPIVSTCSL